MESAGVFRGSVQSVKSHVVYALGLNLVVMTLRVSAPWGGDPQTWKGQRPERAAALSLLRYAAVWYCYITVHGAKPVWVRTPWYTAKATPSFADALGALRRELWGRIIYARSDVRPQVRKIADVLIGALASAT